MFSVSLTTVINHDKSSNNSERITNIELFINNYNCKNIKF